MKTSKFLKADKDVLIEYVYNSENLISEGYKILVNIQDKSYSFLSSDDSQTLNTESNQLFQIDPVTNKWGLIDKTTYNFLQTKDYPSGMPLRYDTIRIHFPVNYTFAEYIGFHLKVYGYDYTNSKTYDLSNYFFDITNVDTFSDMLYSSPPIIFLEKLWGKYIEISVPSLFAVSSQRTDTNATPDSINSNLTNGWGMSITSPIFVDYEFIAKSDVINNVKTYTLGNPLTISFPQSPEFQNLAVMIDESVNGDFFEIYGIYNDSIAEFKTFIDNAFKLGNNYYVEYWVTVFEENIQGKTQRFVVTEDFNQKIEYRPIIKFSTTTAVIDVEMKLIDMSDGAQISRMASYGMLEKQLSKYSLNLTKINIDGASKPKIYNLKSQVSESLAGIAQTTRVLLEKVNVPYPVLVERFNIVSRSESAKNGSETYFGMGKMQITVYPFDNVVTFIIAEQVDVTSGVKLMNLNSNIEIKLVFKNTNQSVECGLFMDSDAIDLENGRVIFKVFQKQISSIRKIFDSGSNLFYIVGYGEATSSVIYSGSYVMYDSQSNIDKINDDVNKTPSDQSGAVITPVTNDGRGTAVVTVQPSNDVISIQPIGNTLTSAINLTTLPALTALPTQVLSLDSSLLNQQLLSFDPNKLFFNGGNTFTVNVK
jgi:hypothetical protein